MVHAEYDRHVRKVNSKYSLFGLLQLVIKSFSAESSNISTLNSNCNVSKELHSLGTCQNTFPNRATWHALAAG